MVDLGGFGVVELGRERRGQGLGPGLEGPGEVEDAVLQLGDGGNSPASPSISIGLTSGTSVNSSWNLQAEASPGELFDESTADHGA